MSKSSFRLKLAGSKRFSRAMTMSRWRKDVWGRRLSRSSCPERALDTEDISFIDAMQKASESKVIR